MDGVRKEFSSVVKGKVDFDRFFRDRTYFRIGGPALVWVQPADLEDLRAAIYLCRNLKLDILLFGNGSNILAGDKPIKKAVIELASPFFKKIKFCGNTVSCSSGQALSNLINSASAKGLAGLEPLAGIPGTVGGALAMNAGGRKAEIGKFITSVKVMDYDGGLEILGPGEFRFCYRKSNLSDKIILEAAFKLKRANPLILKKRIAEFLDKKTKTQEFCRPSAGCIFKNPVSGKRPAGWLIEQAGLKGRRIGDAQISETHANFIINLGKAAFEDVSRLMRLAQRAVKKRYNIWLEPEVKIIK